MLRGIMAKRLVIAALVFLVIIIVGISSADDPVQPLSDELCPEADLSGDCFVNFIDLGILANQWLQGPVSCPSGYEDCDANSANGCETYTAGDVNNCGDCDYVCQAIPHGTVGCQDGNCIVAGCDAGWDNCDGNTANGCETNILTNPNHCGSCGYVCNLPHAIEGCSSGNCFISACEAGYANCDGNTANGCEVYLDDGGGTCGGATYLGQVCGDEHTGFLCSSENCDNGPSANGRGEKWYQISLQECESCTANLHIWVQLQPPTNMDYDLYLYAPCGTLLDSSTNGGSQVERVDYVWNDTSGDDGRYVYIEIRYYSGNNCNNWSLYTWGGCPSGP